MEKRQSGSICLQGREKGGKEGGPSQQRQEKAWWNSVVELRLWGSRRAVGGRPSRVGRWGGFGLGQTGAQCLIQKESRPGSLDQQGMNVTRSEDVLIMVGGD